MRTILIVLSIIAALAVVAAGVNISQTGQTLLFPNVVSEGSDEGTTINIQRDGGAYGTDGTNAGTWDVKTIKESVSVDVPDTAPQGYGLWLTDSGYVSQSLYETAALGSIVPLLYYSASGGQAILYDILETAGGIRGNATPLSLPMGMSRGSLQATVIGRHILILISGNSASNVVILDVGQTSSSASGSWQPDGFSGTGEGNRRIVNMNIVSTGPGQQTTTSTGNELVNVDSGMGGSTVVHQPGW